MNRLFVLFVTVLSTHAHIAGAKGRNQSPINLVADLPADLPELVFEYNRPIQPHNSRLILD